MVHKLCQRLKGRSISKNWFAMQLDAMHLLVVESRTSAQRCFCSKP